MNTVVIAGGTGTLGKAVAAHFSMQGYPVTLLTRTRRDSIPYDQVEWDGKTVNSGWGHLLKDSILINLAGELVDRVPTESNIDILERSRTEPTVALAEAAQKYGTPALWLQMSTLAIYGDAGDTILDENSPAAAGPRQMAGIAKSWEACVTDELADRLVILRTAVVIQPNSPALNRLVTMTKWMLGGTVGSGKQWVSWIHIDDFLRALDFVVSKRAIAGIVHLSSPEPVTNREMMRILRKELHRPWTPATPTWVLKIGAFVVFRTDPKLALTGRRAVPSKLLASGFHFEHPNFAGALSNLLTS